eukprot:4245792-Pleurochrysis_carterae.AAC.4
MHAGQSTRAGTCSHPGTCLSTVLHWPRLCAGLLLHVLLYAHACLSSHTGLPMSADLRVCVILYPRFDLHLHAVSRSHFNMRAHADLHLPTDLHMCSKLPHCMGMRAPSSHVFAVLHVRADSLSLMDWRVRFGKHAFAGPLSPAGMHPHIDLSVCTD